MAVVQGESRRIGLTVPLAWTFLVSRTFQGMRAALADIEAYRSFPRGEGGGGSLDVLEDGILPWYLL